MELPRADTTRRFESNVPRNCHRRGHNATVIQIPFGRMEKLLALGAHWGHGGALAYLA